MISGEWTGTMCLTEAHCGTDLGLLRTRAVPRGDGSLPSAAPRSSFRRASMIWPTTSSIWCWRLPDAPPGIRGISLFLVPKVLPDGRRNGVECTGIEHKTGLRGSATCQLAFDEATGWLVGEANKAWPRCSP
jgi:alkylation response protein AidB-like acyl-CoA dehydrogenase